MEIFPYPTKATERHHKTQIDIILDGVLFAYRVSELWRKNITHRCADKDL